ncbi:MAG TPA: S8 family serine peptidase, partial [Candidatus Polarisedimenticolaceae bacterium]|nr:S8 family serine peptidase [Candidatus Polarisedimenticolaceae bacterium]
MPKPPFRLALALLASALLAPAFAAPEPEPELRLTSGTFRPARALPSPPAWFHETRLATSAHGSRYVVAILAGPLAAPERERLESAGAQILDYLPMHGYRLRLAPDAEAAVRRLPFVRWLGVLPPHLKIEPQLAAGAGKPAGETAIRIILAAGEPERRVLEALDGLRPLAAPSGKDGAWRVSASIPAARLAAALSAIASLPEVEAIEPVHRFRPMNQDAVWVHQSFVGPSPQVTPMFDHGIFGCGQIAAVADSAQDYDLCFFRDLTNGPPPVSTCSAVPCPPASIAPRRKDLLYYNWSGGPTGEEDTCPATITGASGHGTHTSGSLAGDQAPYADCAGFTTPNRNGGDGQAPGAKLVVQEMGDGLEYLNDLGGTVWNLTDVAFQNGARIHSNSWGGACYDQLGSCIPGCTAPYDSYSRDADLAMWTHPDLLVVAAAGNGGAFCPPPISIGTPAIAKSPLVVGSVGHGSAATIPSWFTSPGPVHDGRLGPSVAAQGESTVSAASDMNLSSNNCGTCSLDGSSMSAPTAAGLAALVREYYVAGFLAAGTRNPAQGFTPSAALLKATLVDGAVALGASAPDPDFDSGYGRIQLDRTLPFAGSSFQLRVDDRREGLVTGGVVVHAYDVSAGTPFRATLAWSDYPAALNAAIARVNELKLEVVDPSGTVWFQTLDPGTGEPVATSAPGDPHDTRNVLERLVFDAPAAGRWIVRVRGIDVPFGPQPFALVVRGALTDCPAPAPPPAPTLGAPADNQVSVSWSSVPGAVRYTVYRSFGSCPATSWIPIATVSGTSYLDGTVSGGATYSYAIAAASDTTAACESPRSSCASIVPTGDCILVPSFHGLTGAASAGLASCTVNLSWSAGSAFCGSDLRYNVYRGTTSTFTPSAANRIARCVSGTSFSDGVDLAYGSPRWYVVRAEDATSGHAGPCRGGNEETNTIRVSTSPDGPPAIGTWTDDAGDIGTAKMLPSAPWTVATTEGRTGPNVYTALSSDGVCADVTTPVLTLAAPGQGPQLTFWTKHNLDYDPTGEIFGTEGSLGQVEIATGPSFSGWTRVPLTPNYPELVEFPFNDCPTTANI